MVKIKKITFELLQTPTWISILLGGIFLLWQTIFGAIPPSVQIVFFAFFILLTGIPHGALDHLVEAETALRKQIPFNSTLFTLKYLLTMAFYGLVWLFFPTLSLFFFLIISAWHFGETDLEDAPSIGLWQVARFLFGGLLLASLLLTHATENTPIWSRITHDEQLAITVWQFAVEHTVLILTFWAFLLVIVLIIANRLAPLRFDKLRLLRLGIILILAYFLPLMPAFALYFGGWHALCSFKSIHNYLIENPKMTARTPLSIWVKSMPYTGVSLVFMTAAMLYWENFLQTWDPLPLIYIFLSLITLPHLNVMHGMNSWLSLKKAV